VKKYFDGIRPGPPVDRATQWVPRLDGTIRDEMRDNVVQTRVYRIANGFTPRVPCSSSRVIRPWLS
jgi:hypothetical protein